MRDDATELDHLPGDNGPPLINYTLAFFADPRALDAKQLRQYGRLRRTRFFGRTIVRAGAVELADEILVDRERVYSNHFGWAHFLGHLFPGGLMLRDFDDHRRHRKILRAGFGREARRGYQSSINAAFARSLDSWAREPTLRFYPAVKRALFEQAAQVFLGVEAGAESARLAKLFDLLIQGAGTPFRVPLPGTKWRRCLDARRELEGYLRAELPRRRAQGRVDLFSRLCDASDEDTGARLDDEEIVDHMIFIVFAAHDTTASGLSSMIDELSARPELLARVVRSCRELAPEQPEHGLGWGQLDELKLIDGCFREALRLNPPVPSLVRRTVRSCELGGHALPPRAPVTVVVREVHTDPELWPQPERFDPDRFDAGRQPEAGGCPRHRHAWLSFGAGSHRCIGAELAMQQVKVMCYQLFRRFELERCASSPTTWKRVPLPYPVDGLPLRIRAIAP